MLLGMVHFLVFGDGKKVKSISGRGSRAITGYSLFVGAGTPEISGHIHIGYGITNVPGAAPTDTILFNSRIFHSFTQGVFSLNK